MSFSDIKKIGSFNQNLFLNPEMELRINIPHLLAFIRKKEKNSQGLHDCEADLSTAAIFRPTSSWFGKVHRCQAYPNFCNVYSESPSTLPSNCVSVRNCRARCGNVAYGRVRCLENCALWLVLVNRMSEERRVSFP